MSLRLRVLVPLLLIAIGTSSAQGVPVKAGGPPVVAERKGFIPLRKHQPLPGKIVAVLVPDAQMVLGLEGRSGPVDQVVLGYGGASYRWVYVPVENKPLVPRMIVPVGNGAESKQFTNLSLASPATLKPMGIESRYALVEVEVNGGLGSPAVDAFVATKLRRIDGTSEFPAKIDDIIAELSKQYQIYLGGQSREIDVAMEKSAAAAIGNRKATGPRERLDLMYVTWISQTGRLRVHFYSTISDGAYEYEGGINIDLGRPVTMAARGPVRAAPGGRLPNGLRYGKQFGVEFGMAYEVTKDGKVDRTLTLPIEAFQRELKNPGIFSGNRSTIRGAPRTMRR